MIRGIIFALLGAVALAGSAFAADLPSRAPPAVYVPPAPIFTWTGIYAGIQLGYAWGRQNGSFGDTLGNFISLNDGGDGVIGGGHVGYNLQFTQFVVGLEGNVDASSISKRVTLTPAGADVYPLTLYTQAYVQGSIRARVGYSLTGIGWDRVLIYAAGGAAFAGTTANLKIGYPFGTVDSASSTRVGWTVGGGLEYAITNNWSIRAEYRYSDFGHTTFFPNGFFDRGIFINKHFTENQVQAGFSYKFDTLASPAPIVAKY